MSDLRSLSDQELLALRGKKSPMRPVSEWTDEELLSGQALGPGTGNNVNYNSEVGNVFDRAATSIKMTPQGKMGYLQARGYDPIQSGEEIFARQGSGYVPLDKEGFTGGDVADLAGPGIEMAAGFTMSRNPLAVASRTAGGNVVRQGLSALLPGSDQMSLVDRGQQAGGSGLAGGGLQFGFNTVGAVGRNLSPTNLMQKFVANREALPAAAEGRAIEQATGVPLTPGQRTQSRTLLTVEGLLRRNPLTADPVYNADITQLDKSLKALNTTLDNTFRAGKANAETTGAYVGAVFNKALEDASKLRSSVARNDFKLVDDTAGGKPIIGTINTADKIGEIIQRYDAPGAGDATSAMVNKLKRLQTAFGQGKPVTGAVMQRYLQIYGEAARGKGEVLKGVSPTQQQSIAGQVMDALLTDVDDAVANGGFGANIAESLKVARQRYAENSKVISDIKDSALSDVLGFGSPEAVADRVVKMAPSQLKSTLQFLERSDPASAATVKRYAFERMMNDAGVPMSDAAPRTMASTTDGQQVSLWSPRKLATSMQKSPIWDALSPDEQLNMKTIFGLMSRVADRAGTDGSPTAPLSQAWDAVKSGIQGSAAPFLYALGARKLTQVLFDPVAARNVVAIHTADPKSAQYARAVSYLGYLIGTE